MHTINRDSIHEYGPDKFWTTAPTTWVPGKPPPFSLKTDVGNRLPFFHTHNMVRDSEIVAWHYRQMVGPLTLLIFTNAITTETRTKMVHEMNLEQYRAALRNHDWDFEFSEDPRVVRRGKLEREALEAKRRVYDRDYSVWNTIAPIEYRRTTD